MAVEPCVVFTLQKGARTMRRMQSPGLYGLALVVLGVILGWWLTDRPIDQFDEAIQYKLHLLVSPDSTGGLLVIVIIIAIIVLLFRRK